MRKSVLIKTEILLATMTEAASQSGKSVEQIADELQISESNLYKQLSPTSETDFKLKFFMPFMKATKSAKPLAYMASKMGYLMVRKPAGYRSASALKLDINTYQRDFNTVMICLFDFLNQPTSKKLMELEELLFDHMARTETVRRICKKNPNQQTLF